MFRKTTLLVASLALMLMAPRVHAAAGDWMITVNGGLGIPAGDFSDDNGLGAGLGFNVGADVDYMINDMFAVGVDGSFASNNLKSDLRDAVRDAGDPTFDIKYTQFGGGAHVKYWFPIQNSPVSAYLVGGAGVSNFKGELESTVFGNSDQSKTQFAARGGVGVGYKASDRVTVGVEGNFNYVTLDEADWGVSSATGVGVRGMVSFGLRAGGQ